MKRLAIAALLLLPAAAPEAGLDDVFATERAFAARAGEAGIPRSFTEFAAPGGLVFLPAPTNVAKVYGGKPRGSGRLDWRPVYGGISQAGDLAFDAGPWTMTDAKGAVTGRGYFFTVWGRQPDGQWRFLADNGIEAASAGEPFDTKPVAACSPAFAKGDFDGVEAADADLNEELASDARNPHAFPLALGAWLMRAGSLPGKGDGFRTLIASGPETYRLTAIGGGIAKSGDLAWTYGGGSWDVDGKLRTGSYLRVWQRHADRWMLAMTAIVPAPE